MKTRKHILLLLAFFILLVVSGIVMPGREITQAAYVWTETQPLGNVDSKFRAVASSSDGSHLLAGGEKGLFTSADGGVNWTERQPCGVSGDWWIKVASDADGSNLIAVDGNRNTIFISADYGVTWIERLPPGINWPSYAVASNDDGSILMATYGEYLYISTDGGVNWTQAQTSVAVSFTLACDADGSVIIAAGIGNATISTDSGATWTDVTIRDRCYCAASNNDGSTLILGVSSGIYISKDRGTTWTYKYSNSSSVVNAISCSADGLTIIAAYENFLLVSSDGGMSWHSPGIGSVYPHWWGAATDASGEHLIAADYAGRLYIGKKEYQLDFYAAPGFVNGVDSGTEFYDIHSNTVVTLTATPDVGYHFTNWSGDASGTNPVTTVTMDADKSVIANFDINTYTLTYVAGAGGSVSGQTSQTVDYGGHADSWKTVFSGEGGKFIAVDPTDPSILYVSCVDKLYRSADTGFSWTLVYDASPVHLYFRGPVAIDPHVHTTIYVTLDGGGVLRSTDSGVTWNERNTGLPADLRIRNITVDPVTSTTLYAIHTFDGIFRSMDSGLNWESINNGFPATPFEIFNIVVDPHNSQVLYCAIYGAGIFQSVDGGTSWTTKFIGSDFNLMAIDAVHSTILYASTWGVWDTRLFRSTDSGVTWTAIGTTVPYDIITLIADPNIPSTLYVSTSDGAFLSIDNGNTWTGPLSANDTDVWDQKSMIVVSGQLYAATYYRVQAYAPVTAIPDTGYHFVQWSDGVLTPERNDTNVTADITATAEFALDAGGLFNVSVQIPDRSAPYVMPAAPHGSFYAGTIAGMSANIVNLAVGHSVSVPYGDSITITASIPVDQQNRYYVYAFFLNGVPAVPDSYAIDGYEGAAALSTIITEDTVVMPYFELIGDLNLDGYVNILDLNIMLSMWNQPEMQTQMFVNKHVCRDINRDGNINLSDVSLLLARYNT